MSKTGGARAGAGRPSGSLNRRSSEVVAEALAAGTTPLEYMLEIMRDADADPKRRDWAAEKCAMFLHPRPAPMERTVQIELPDTSTVQGVDQALDAVISAMGRGELSPHEGQGFIAVIEARRKAIEAGELLDRIEALEKAQGGNRR